MHNVLYSYFRVGEGIFGMCTLTDLGKGSTCCRGGKFLANFVEKFFNPIGARGHNLQALYPEGCFS